MKNYLTISIALCLAFVSNNIFAIQPITSDILKDNSNSKCYFEQFLESKDLPRSKLHDLRNSAKAFFGEYIDYVNGKLKFGRCTVKTPMSKSIADNNASNIDRITKCNIGNGSTMFMGASSVLSMGSGSVINIFQNSKLLILGALKIEENCVINIGERPNSESAHKGKGGYLIINAENPIDVSKLTINLYDEDSHLEVHGNKIDLSKTVVNRLNDKATVHFEANLFRPEFRPQDQNKKPNYKPDQKPKNADNTDKPQHLPTQVTGDTDTADEVHNVGDDLELLDGTDGEES